MGLIVIVANILIGQFSMPSDACDACEYKCEEEYRKTSVLASDVRKIDTVYSQTHKAHYLLERSFRTYKRSECQLNSSIFPFSKAAWQVSTNPPLLKHSSDTLAYNKVYVGLICDSISKSFYSNVRFKKLGNQKMDKGWKKFSWEKWGKIKAYGSTTCPCGLQTLTSGEDAYINACKPHFRNWLEIIPVSYVHENKRCKRFSSKGSYRAVYSYELKNSIRVESIKIDFGTSEFQIQLGSDSLHMIATSKDTITIKRMPSKYATQGDSIWEEDEKSYH